MKYYFINIDDSYYGKNKQYLPLNSGKDMNELALIVGEIGYKTKQGAEKGVKSLVDMYKRNNLIVKKIQIESTKVELVTSRKVEIERGK